MEIKHDYTTLEMLDWEVRQHTDRNGSTVPEQYDVVAITSMPTKGDRSLVDVVIARYATIGHDNKAHATMIVTALRNQQG